MFRTRALGKFRDLLIEVARDPAMLVWLDGRLNTRQRPQENFGREIMELFTLGVGHYTEQDVYAAARVFTGWSIRLVGAANNPNSYYEFVYQRVAARADGEDVHVSDLCERQQGDSRARGGGRDAGRHRLHRRAGTASRNRAAARPQAVELLRQRRRSAGTRFHRRCRASLPPERHQHAQRRRLRAAVAAVSKPRSCLRAVFMAGGVRCPLDQGSRLDRLFDRQRPRLAGDDGADAVSSLQTLPAGSSARDGSRPAPCWRG